MHISYPRQKAISEDHIGLTIGPDAIILRSKKKLM